MTSRDTDDPHAPGPCAWRAAETLRDASRRNLMRRMGAAAALATGVSLPERALASFGPDYGFGSGDDSALNLPPDEMEPQKGDRLTPFHRKKRGAPIRAEEVEIGAKQLLVLPLLSQVELVRDGSRFNQILLQRFDSADLDPETAKRSANGIVAYSAICTHTGCPVTGWDSDAVNYMCPCHQSTYDPRAAASVTGGPAPRALPSLPLAIEDGEITVAGLFTTEVGFGS